MVTATLNSRLVKQLEVNIKSRLIVQDGQNTSGISKGSARDAPPSYRPYFFNSMQFSGKNGQNNRFAPLPLGLAPSLENPRSVNKNVVKYRIFGQK